MSALVFAVFALATARVTRFITTDRIFEAPRDWILDRVNPAGMVTYFLGCPWCVSTWVGAVLAPIAWYGNEIPVVAIIAIALAFSHITGLIASFTEGDG